ncbi:hypothetical protein ESA94_20590 [Lacibacter luteus]|uniref:TonB C-terminal domain-containing protein n=1 Tax=Lacibacter luteus TaxID=2508719 RepID=A0A4Q1CDN6_9BACT|nr:hypothetical protein [Lacibacter luteus]RXK57599.1 hypothetical protein ESA94_20590 [Lacibacter luteus]
MKKKVVSTSYMKCILTVLVLITCYEQLLAQKQLKKECFEAEINSENVFTKIEIVPSFIGGSNTFKSYLNSSGGFGFLSNELLNKDSIYFDTARVRFIISKYGVMSNLSVTKCHSESYKKEVYQVIRGSACGWIPGNFSGRNINGWVQIDIYFQLKRCQDNSIQKTVSYKQYDYKTDD